MRHHRAVLHVEHRPRPAVGARGHQGKHLGPSPAPPRRQRRRRRGAAVCRRQPVFAATISRARAEYVAQRASAPRAPPVIAVRPAASATDAPSPQRRPAAAADHAASGGGRHAGHLAGHRWTSCRASRGRNRRPFLAATAGGQPHAAAPLRPRAPQHVVVALVPVVHRHVARAAARVAASACGVRSNMVRMRPAQGRPTIGWSYGQ